MHVHLHFLFTVEAAPHHKLEQLHLRLYSPDKAFVRDRFARHKLEVRIERWFYRRVKRKAGTLKYVIQ